MNTSKRRAGSVTLIITLIFLALSRPGAGQLRLQDQISRRKVGPAQRLQGYALSLDTVEIVGDGVVRSTGACNGEGLAHFASVLKDPAANRGYRYSHHVMPHDIEVRELSADAVTRKETEEALGIKPLVVVKRREIGDGIEAVRNLLARCYFDEEMCGGAEGAAPLPKGVERQARGVVIDAAP